MTLTGQLIDAKAGAVYYAGPKAGTPANFSPDDFDNQVITADQFGKSSLKGFYGNAKLEINLDDSSFI